MQRIATCVASEEQMLIGEPDDRVVRYPQPHRSHWMTIKAVLRRWLRPSIAWTPRQHNVHP